MLNEVKLIGHVGKKPDIRTTPQGNKVANFSLATSERWTDKQTGERKEKTEWHRITVWGDDIVTKLVEPYIQTGSKLYVSGKLQTREWTDDKDVKRYATEIIVQGLGGTITLLDRKENSGPPPADAPPEGRYAEAPREPARPDHQAPAGYTPPPLSTPPGRPPGPPMGYGQQIDDSIPF